MSVSDPYDGPIESQPEPCQGCAELSEDLNVARRTIDILNSKCDGLMVAINNATNMAKNSDDEAHSMRQQIVDLTGERDAAIAARDKMLVAIHESHRTLNHVGYATGPDEYQLRYAGNDLDDARKQAVKDCVDLGVQVSMYRLFKVGVASAHFEECPL